MRLTGLAVLLLTSLALAGCASQSGGGPGDQSPREWFREQLARAECGDAYAQEAVATQYEKEAAWMPRNVLDFTYDPQVLAYKWYQLSASGGWRLGTEGLARVAEAMSPKQIARAERLVAEWRPKDCPAGGTGA